MSPVPLSDAPVSTLEACPDGYAIRTLSAEDAQTLFRLDQVIFDDDAWPLQMFRDELSHPEWRRYWGVVDRGDPQRLVGYLGLQYTPRIADVQSIGVLPNHQRRGLAGYLMSLARERAQAWGAESLMLEVRVDNEPAKALYLRHGFETIHTRRHYYPDGTDALIMSSPVHHNTKDRA